jgi:hypothetical protein
MHANRIPQTVRRSYDKAPHSPAKFHWQTRYLATLSRLYRAFFSASKRFDSLGLQR